MSTEHYDFLGMQAVFSSPVMAGLLEKVRRYAIMDSAVLIGGESGAGKEAIARALHQFSIRVSKPWVDVSCGALPEHLVESELFGYEKGAFSGADTVKQGLFEVADQGTLFLDEIGELETKVQVKLLRILDCGEYYRLGGTRKVRVRVRIVAATNQDLRSGVSEGWFRKDLYHRLAQLRIHVPPLRERQEDIQPLTEFFLERIRPNVRISSEVHELFLRYSWPGNVRELRNAITSCVAASNDNVIRLEHVPEEILETGRTSQLHQLASFTGPSADSESNTGLLETTERRVIQQTLQMTNGHQERAAKILGISSRTLSRKLKEYQLSEPALQALR
jgi:two-component system response regulator AtoC